MLGYRYAPQEKRPGGHHSNHTIQRRNVQQQRTYKLSHIQYRCQKDSWERSSDDPNEWKTTRLCTSIGPALLMPVSSTPVPVAREILSGSHQHGGYALCPAKFLGVFQRRIRIGLDQLDLLSAISTTGQKLSENRAQTVLTTSLETSSRTAADRRQVRV